MTADGNRRFDTGPGQPHRLGSIATGEGVDFAVFSAHATAIDLCLFSPDGKRELARLPMRYREGDIWHLRVAGVRTDAAYGFRAYGPYAPEVGHRFNPNKLLIDPYARRFSGDVRWSDVLMGYKVGAARADLSFDARDSAFAVPKSLVTKPLATLTDALHTPWRDTRNRSSMKL
ncbi:hypothetical protein [Pseudorhodobacter sp.]|uniref:hypothetical protein n=1 Tax=Pseudorhodobacter sp. TaxID=1934400 RepID=UPI002648D7AA|nr:hypothetical protein [Pseudorhodobacter sp.]MDN5789112.1 hypothetical protein [Pseudorhodobacter sp.]